MLDDSLKTTPLHRLHQALDARMVAFAGYELPVQYRPGVLAEHRHTRAAAGLFDVSHMGQIRLAGPDVAAELEALVPGDIVNLPPGRMRYTVFTAASGGILDDLMIANAGDHFIAVVNAARKEHDLAHLKDHVRGDIELLADRALVALQGPASELVLESLAPGAAGLGFLQHGECQIAGVTCGISRSGYTGEDGYEISVPARHAIAVAEELLASDSVMATGLGARDSLRLEAGLCLYGQDIDTDTTPVEAGLSWVIGKRRRAAGGFPGHGTILQQLREGPPRRRVGICPDGRAPIRAGTRIFDVTGTPLGAVTSGGFGPSVDGPVAMGYIARPLPPGTPVQAEVRNRLLPATVAALPFVRHRYKRLTAGAAT